MSSPQPAQPTSSEPRDVWRRWEDDPRFRLWRSRLAPLFTLAGVYAVQWMLTRTNLRLHGPVDVTRPFRALPVYLFQGWDGGHYFQLARELTTFAWPPLYPLLLRALSAIFTVQALEKAAVLCNIAAHVGIAYGVYALVRAHPKLEAIPGWFVTALLFFFPGHNVFFAAYSESVYLAFTLWSAVMFLRARYAPSGLLAGLACLTRLLGVYFGAALSCAAVYGMLRRRRLELWPLLGVSVWVLGFAGWVLYVHVVGNTSLTAAQLPWQQELLAVHVPAGENPKAWVFRYLALSEKKEVFFFWPVVVAALYWAARRMPLLSLYLGFFLVTFALHLYRPFPFTRFVSVLFPVALMLGDVLRRWRGGQVVTVAVCAIQASAVQMLLFSNRMGEP